MDLEISFKNTNQNAILKLKSYPLTFYYFTFKENIGKIVLMSLNLDICFNYISELYFLSIIITHMFLISFDNIFEPNNV